MFHTSNHELISTINVEICDQKNFDFQFVSSETLNNFRLRLILTNGCGCNKTPAYIMAIFVKTKLMYTLFKKKVEKAKNLYVYGIHNHSILLYYHF